MVSLGVVTVRELETPGSVNQRESAMLSSLRFVPTLNHFKSQTGPKARNLLGHWQAVVVWGFWVAAVVWLGAFVGKYGINLPSCDEWAFIDVFYGSTAEQFKWLGESHSEHHFILGRVVYLTTFWLSGHDFRAGMWVTVGLFAAASALLILAARSLRGHTSLADIAFPLLFLHAGHTENLLMGYQIVFTITVCALALFAFIVARSADVSPGTSAFWASACMLVAAFGGWLGLLYAAGMWAWAAWQALRAKGEPILRAVVVFVLGVVAVYACWSLACLLVSMNGRFGDASLPLATRLQAVAEVMGMGLGVGVAQYIKLTTVGTILIALQIACAAFMARVAIRQPERRAVAMGVLTLLFGTWFFALGVGYSRGSGYASRYTSFTAFGIVIPMIVVAWHFPKASWLVFVVVAVPGYFVTVKNCDHGRNLGKFSRIQYANVLNDIRAGMPIDVLADRHVDFWQVTRRGWLALWDNKFPLLRDLPPLAEGRQEVSLPFRHSDDFMAGKEGFDRYHVDFQGMQQVSFVRVKFRASTWKTWEPLSFNWIDPITAERTCSKVYPWVWVADHEAVFWIDGLLTKGELIMGRPECQLNIQSVGFIRKENN